MRRKNTKIIWNKTPILWFIYRLFAFLCSLLLINSLSVAATPQDKEHANFYRIYITKAITDYKIFPYTPPEAGSFSKDLLVRACPGESEAASFVVHAVQKLLRLSVTPTSLKQEKSEIPAGAVDIRVVKCWFQSGANLRETKSCVLTPELLLKDGQLVQVDLKEKKNYLRTVDASGITDYVCISGKDSKKLADIRPQDDAATLQPVTLKAGTNKQFWIQVQVPENAAPGLYHGKLKLTAVNALPDEINLQLQVLPFKLAKPALRYAIYYRGALTRDSRDWLASSKKSGLPVINPNYKTLQQYTAELQDLKAHGIDYPTIYQHDEKLLRKELEIRDQLGFPKDALYNVAVATGNPTTPEALNRLTGKVQQLLKIAREFGYKEVYVYGIDCAAGERLKSQRAAWEAVHRVGGKVFAAVSYRGSFELVGDILDLPVIGADLDPRQARQYHEAGHLAFNRGNPQCGQEEPETYRRNYGLLLWKSGYDGAMNYAYQANYGGHIWNDFDVPAWRNQVFAYPTVNGVIDTIEWEGQKAAVDDVRYLTTLLKAIQEAGPAGKPLAAEAQKWVDGLDPRGDLDNIRQTMIDYITRLKIEK